MKTALVRAAVKAASKSKTPADLAREFVAGQLAESKPDHSDAFKDLMDVEERASLAMWDTQAIEDLPSGETVIVKRFVWDGENRHTMTVETRVKGWRQRAGVPRGIGLAREHPGITALYLYMAYRHEVVPGKHPTEHQALDYTRQVFPECPPAERIGRLRRVRRQFTATLGGSRVGPLFEALKPLAVEKSIEKMVEALKAAERSLRLSKEQKAEWRTAVKTIAERAGA